MSYGSMLVLKLVKFNTFVYTSSLLLIFNCPISPYIHTAFSGLLTYASYVRFFAHRPSKVTHHLQSIILCSQSLSLVSKCDAPLLLAVL